ncbi:RH1 [Scenedesmus sp. PABB004]|nr:RH1 [Scenedesmus sp. PABB004]
MAERRQQQPAGGATAAAGTPGAGAAAPVLPWMRVPLAVPAGGGVPLSEVRGLRPGLAAGVAGLGFTELFPVQAAVWRGLAGGASAAHDMCVCAPTGSGKTLAYALPLLNAVAAGAQPGRRVLAGLVVLPTRDLAVQVAAVLSPLGASAGVAVALAAAQEGVAAEAARLAAAPGRPGSGPQVLVATPGRLIAHLTATPGFSLAGLRWLVVDEADRLLRQDYQGWLPQVLAAAGGGGGQRAPQPREQQQQQQQRAPEPALAPDACAPPLLPWCAGGEGRLVKLVVSATLTRDPAKLQRLALHAPRFISLAGVGHRYALPPALAQHRVVVPAQHKPLALLGLLHRLADTTVIVFASSLDTTHRLYLLLAAVPGLPGGVAEYSSLLPPAGRAAALAAFRRGDARVLVTSDAMARGMDVPAVGCVVNYDPPAFPKTYVHRAGRTARAGAAGAVYSLLKPEDVVHFNAMAAKLQGGAGRVAALRLPPESLAPLRAGLRDALGQVQALLAAERADAAAAARREREPAAEMLLLLRGLLRPRAAEALAPALLAGPLCQPARGAKAAAKKKGAAPAKGGKGKAAGGAGKKSKQRMESRPFDEKDPLMQKVIAMLVPPAEAPPPPRTPAQQAEVVSRAKEFSRLRMREHAAWVADVAGKIRLKRAALQALPPALRDAAQQEDLAPFPLTRHFLYDTPPEAYRD